MDSLRLMSALWVLIMHAFAIYFPDQSKWAFHWGHSAVVVFFVLSGYVIAYTTDVKNRGVKQYAQARLSRLYSIVVPAIIITVICDLVLLYVNPQIHQFYQRGSALPRYFTSSFFLNEIWFTSSAPPINAPLWSLSFEFWYYVIFGLIFFRATIKYFWLAILVCCVIAGPKILVMMPIWLMGVLAFRVKSLVVSGKFNWTLVILCWVGAICVIAFCPGIPREMGTAPFFFGAQFITDWIIGICIALSLICVPVSGHSSSIGSSSHTKFYSFFRKAADLTFPIYILHHPLLVLFNASISLEKNNYIRFVLAIFVVLLFCVVIGVFLEKLKPWWDQVFKNLLVKIKALASF